MDLNLPSLISAGGRKHLYLRGGDSATATSTSEAPTKTMEETEEMPKPKSMIPPKMESKTPTGWADSFYPWTLTPENQPAEAEASGSSLEAVSPCAITATDLEKSTPGHGRVFQCCSSALQKSLYYRQRNGYILDQVSPLSPGPAPFEYDKLIPPAPTFPAPILYPSDEVERRAQRNFEFCNAQLVPDGFLYTGKWNNLRPGNFLVELEQSPLLTLDAISFFVTPNFLEPFFDHNYFTVRIVSPSGKRVGFHVCRGPTAGLHYVFRSQEPGSHIISVCLGVRGTHHVDGSPLSIDICRNYNMYGQQTALMKDVLATPSANELRLREPIKCRLWGITADDKNETIFATDVGGNQILKFALSPDKILLSGIFNMSRMGWGAGKTCEPTAITFDPTSSLLFMTDIANHRVCKLTQEGKYVSSIGKPGSEDGGLVVPCGIAVSPDGTLAIVADSNNHRIQLFNSHSGEFVRAQVVLQGRSKYRKEVSCPTGIVFDKSGGRIFFSDTNNEMVMIYDLNFVVQLAIDHHPYNKLSSPHGLAIDDVGNILICDPQMNTLRIFNSVGNLLYAMGGTGLATFYRPEAVIVLRGGFCCILDQTGTRLRIF